MTVRGRCWPPDRRRMAVFATTSIAMWCFRQRRRERRQLPQLRAGRQRFHQLNATNRRSCNEWWSWKGTADALGFEGSRCSWSSRRHSGKRPTARKHSLQFYSFMGSRRRRAYHTALAHDTSLTNRAAVLDAVRPRIRPFEPETSALHEALVTSVHICALSHDVIRRRVVGSLDRLNLLSEIPRVRRGGSARWGSIRTSWCRPSDGRIDRAARSVAQALEHYLLALRSSSNLMRQDSPGSRLHTARTVIQRMLFVSMDFLRPPTAPLRVREALLAADRSVHTDRRLPRDRTRRPGRRGLVSKREGASTRRGWTGTRPAGRGPRCAMLLFLNANRRRLALHPMPISGISSSATCS